MHSHLSRDGLDSRRGPALGLDAFYAASPGVGSSCSVALTSRTERAIVSSQADAFALAPLKGYGSAFPTLGPAESQVLRITRPGLGCTLTSASKLTYAFRRSTRRETVVM